LPAVIDQRSFGGRVAATLVIWFLEKAPSTVFPADKVVHMDYDDLHKLHVEINDIHLRRIATFIINDDDEPPNESTSRNNYAVINVLGAVRSTLMGIVFTWSLAQADGPALRV